MSADLSSYMYMYLHHRLFVMYVCVPLPWVPTMRCPACSESNNKSHISHLRTLEELSLSGTLYSQVISTPYIMPGLCPVGDWNVCVISGSLHFWTVTQLDVLPQCDFKAEYAFQRKLKKYHGVYQVGVVLKEEIQWVYKGWVWC